MPETDDSTSQSLRSESRRTHPPTTELEEAGHSSFLVHVTGCSRAKCDREAAAGVEGVRNRKKSNREDMMMMYIERKNKNPEQLVQLEVVN